MADPPTRADPDGAVRRALRSAPVRQALILIAVFVAVHAASLGAAYLKLRADLAAELRAELRSEAASLDVAATPRALAAIVGARARATDPADAVFVFLRADGGQIGNVIARLDGDAVHLVPIEGSNGLSPAGYIQEVRRLSGGILILGVSLAPVRALTDTFVTLFLLSLVPTALVSLLIGALLARRDARRVAQIERILDRLSGGDLAARVEPPTGADDMARIARGVNRLAQKQQASTEALRQVSTDIAHDLKTPLQRVAVLIEELRGRLDEGSEAAALAAGAAEETDRAVRVFSAMLRIAQIEGGNLAARFAPLDLCETARRIAELYQPAIEEAGDALALDLPGAPVVVTGDAELIGQALSNLIENAHRHTPPGSRIAVSVTAGAGGPGISVADDGPGIPPDERGNVTRRFYRLERSRSTPGQGLGLSLVAAIAELHGGRLSLADNGPGTVARLGFPAGP